MTFFSLSYKQSWKRFLHYINQDHKIIKNSRFFDAKWYKKQYSNFFLGDPALHYLKEGWIKNFNPSPIFSTKKYLLDNPDVKKKLLNPLLHYEIWGIYENRKLIKKSNNWRILLNKKIKLDEHVNIIKNSRFFDAKWYKKNYMKKGEETNPYLHYLLIGSKKYANPSKGFSAVRYIIQNPEAEILDIEPLLHFAYYKSLEIDDQLNTAFFPSPYPPGTNKKIIKQHTKIQDSRIKKQFSQDIENLIVYLVPDFDQIAGGFMCICNYANDIKEFNELKSYSKIVATIPSTNTFSDYTMFDAGTNIFRFEQICKHFKNLKKLILHIPEYQFEKFMYYTSTKEWAFMSNLDCVTINLMNQNNEIMPAPSHVKMLNKIFHNMTMTCAHKNYCNKHLRSTYSLPLHYIPAEKKLKFNVKPYSKKADLLLLSPDEHPLRDSIISSIKKMFPNIKIITIANMPFKKYLKLLGLAKWVISFGEGMDGYTIESLYSGTISFTVHNEIFFEDTKTPWPNTYENFNKLYESIAHDMKRLDNEKSYNQFLKQAQDACFKERASINYEKSLKDYYIGNYTLPFDDILKKRLLTVNSNPLISVIIPVTKFFEDVFASILNQTYSNMELVIFQHGADKTTKNLIENFLSSQNKKIKYRYIESVNEISESDTLQESLKYADGEYIAFGRERDIWIDNKLEVLLKNIDDFDISFGNVAIIDEFDNLITNDYEDNIASINMPRWYHFKELIEADKIHISSALVRSSFIKSIDNFNLPKTSFFWWLTINATVLGKGCVFAGDYVTYWYKNSKHVKINNLDELYDFILYINKILGSKLSKKQLNQLYLYKNWLTIFAVLSKTAKNLLEPFMLANKDAFNDEVMKEIVQKINLEK